MVVAGTDLRLVISLLSVTKKTAWFPAFGEARPRMTFSNSQTSARTPWPLVVKVRVSAYAFTTTKQTIGYLETRRLALRFTFGCVQLVASDD